MTETKKMRVVTPIEKSSDLDQLSRVFKEISDSLDKQECDLNEYRIKIKGELNPATVKEIGEAYTKAGWLKVSFLRENPEDTSENSITYNGIVIVLDRESSFLKRTLK